MKHTLCVLLMLALCACPMALAENGEGLFDVAALEEDETLFSFLDDNHIDTVYRPDGQPFYGDVSEGSVLAYLDYVELPNADVVALRLTIGIETFEELYGSELTLKAGDTELTFAVDPYINEYDMICQEDYTVYLTGDAAGLMDALLKGDGTLAFTIRGDREITGTIAMDPEAIRAIWEKYVALGGPEQDFSKLTQ